MTKRSVDTRRGARLQRWAEKHSLDISEIAAHLQITPGTVRNWLAGVGEPRASQALTLELWKPGFLCALAPHLMITTTP